MGISVEGISSASLGADGISISGLHGRSAAAPAIVPLSPMEASQAPLAIYSLRKVNSAYSGNCLQIRNSLNATANIGFTAAGVVDMAAVAAHAALGDGTAKVGIWYDQSGNGHNATGSVRPKIISGMLTIADGSTMPGIDFQSKTEGLVTTTTPLNIGGTYNLCVLAVYGCYGWSSGGTHSRSPASYTSSGQAIVSYGTSDANRLVVPNGGTAGEALFYNKTKELFVEADATTFPRFRNIAFNQTGANVSGFADERQLWSNRPHAVTGAASQRITVGTTGAGNQSMNGPLFEVILFNPATALSDEETLQMMAWQRDYWGDLDAARYPERYFIAFGGQSNAQYYGTDNQSGNGTAGTNALDRIFVPEIEALIGADTDTLKEVAAVASTTAFGGSGITKASKAADTGETTNYWWDETVPSVGPRLTTFVSTVANAVGAQGAFRYQNPVIIWSQGEEEAVDITASVAGVSATEWKGYTQDVWDYMRTQFGDSTIPVIIQPLGRQGSRDALMRQLRLLQGEMADEDANVYLSAETAGLAMQDNVHFDKYTSSTEGYDLGAKRLAHAVAALIYGVDTPYKGPEISGASFVSTTVIDVTLTYPTGCAGTDFTPTSGILGFTVTDGVGTKTISSAVRQDASTIRITVSTACSGSTTVIYDPQKFADDRTKFVRDNATIPMPLRVSGSITVI